MKWVGRVGIVLAIAVASTSTLAFQEQGSGAPAAGTSAAPAPDAKAPEAQFSAPKSDSGNAGTEVRIPGLGRLGVLPKMDFGLELLYGANEGRQPEAEQQPTPNDDLTIRGSVKHNF